MKNWAAIIIVLLISCSLDKPKEESEIINRLGAGSHEKTTVNDTLGQVGNTIQNEKNIKPDNVFLNCYSAIVDAIGTHNDSLFNSFIHKDFGLYIIESSGALPIISKMYDVKRFHLKSTNKNLFELVSIEIMKEPIFETLPKVICDENIYDKQGCFAQEINPLLESQIWNYANLNEKEIEAIEFLAKTINITVVNTSNFTFYFSKIEGKWHLTFLDLRIPCSA